MENSENQAETNNPVHKHSKFYAGVAILLIIAFGIGYYTGNGRLQISKNGQVTINQGTPPANSADYSLLWDTLNLLNQKDVDRPLDQQKLMYGAISGMVAAVGDPYTVFFDPTSAKNFSDQLSGTFQGIGAEVGSKDNNIVIIAPLPDTPAQKAGILSGDIIAAINGTSTQGMSVDDAVNAIRGKAGTTVKLTILHPNTKNPVDITITRDNIQVKSVALSSKMDGSKKIAVVTISEFGDDTQGLLDNDVNVIAAGNYDGIILDLRDNPGGYLDTAVSTISDWIDAGQVAVQEKSADGSVKNYTTTGIPRLKGMKTVILVNGGSASASEIVSGALQDYKVATLVGEKTFGKGSVQELENLPGGSELKVTVAKWFTPKGRGINKLGLEPDIQVDLTAQDVTNGQDPQMTKALDLLK